MSDPIDSVTELPQVILDYFASANDGRIDDAAACFAEHARVLDENVVREGRGAIREWVASTTRDFQPKTAILTAVENDGAIAIATRVSGNFPGSPVDLSFSFTMTEGKIANLSIQ